MKRKSIVFLLISITPFLLTCKKKTSINATLFNYALNEPVAGATVVLVERHESGWGGTSCKEIASETTGSDGSCSFSREKLKSNRNYDYYLAVKNIYGILQSYPCEGKTSGFLDKGKTQEKILSAGSIETDFKVQYNNLLNPSQPGDSLVVRITSALYFEPGEQYPTGGGGVFVAFPFYGCNGFPFPPTVVTGGDITTCGKKIVSIRKRKMGVVTTSVDTVKVYPNQTTVFQIDW